MAISFTRPDPASPASVSAAQFPVSRRGYDQAEVRDFLRTVAAEQARLQERERALERELRAAQLSRSGSNAVIDEDTATRLLGEEAARVLQTAREAAAQIRGRAEESSARLLREATDEAQRLREEAEIEAARRRQDAAADSEAELQMAKQQGRDMVNEARAYRERVLSELARRRELARQQIEQLIHGRDRLLQAFERSRVAAVEVMAELTPLGEPDEYVNLQPTTGPVPIMVPAAATIADRYLVEDPSHGDPDADTDRVSDDTLAINAVLAANAVLADDDEPEDPVDVDDATSPVYEVDGEAQEEAPEPESGPDAEAPTEADATTEPELAEAETEPESDDDESETVAEVVPLFGPPSDAPAEAPSAETSTAPAATVGDLFAKLRAARAEVVVARATENVAGAEAEPANEPVADASEPDADEEPAVDPGEAAVVPLIVSVARKLKRVLADEQNDLLDTLRRKEPVRNLDALLPWEADQSSRYASAVEADLVAAATAGAQGGENGSQPAVIRPALDAVTNEIVAPLRDRLIRCIDKAEGDNAELGNQVRNLYREWKTHRIDEHVEDIVRLAYSRGALTITSR
jgi:DivIVA domain-containing protein